MDNWLRLGALVAALTPGLGMGPAMAADIEVLHWWTSGGEAKALGELTRKLDDAGHRWRDFPVAGGGGDNAAILLKTRVVSGYPPRRRRSRGRKSRSGPLKAGSRISPKWPGRVSGTPASPR